MVDFEKVDGIWRTAPVNFVTATAPIKGTRGRASGIPDGGFVRRADASERIESAKKAINALLSLDLHLAIKEGLIKEAIWYLTEAEGVNKHKTRYCTVKALSGAEKMNHEHVYQMRHLIQALLENPAASDEILEKAIACTVTVSEHSQLGAISRMHPHLDGWERYAHAEIIVIDTVTGEPLQFS